MLGSLKFLPVSRLGHPHLSPHIPSKVIQVESMPQNLINTFGTLVALILAFLLWGLTLMSLRLYFSLNSILSYHFQIYVLSDLIIFSTFAHY